MCNVYVESTEESQNIINKFIEQNNVNIEIVGDHIYMEGHVKDDPEIRKVSCSLDDIHMSKYSIVSPLYIILCEMLAKMRVPSHECTLYPIQIV